MPYLLGSIDALPHYSAFFKKRLKGLVGPTMVSLLRHLPSQYHQYKQVTDLSKAEVGTRVIVNVTVDEHEKKSNKSPYLIYTHDSAGNLLVLSFFNGRATYLHRLYPTGGQRTVEGKLELYKQALQMNHPTCLGTVTTQASFTGLEPVYPLTEGITNVHMRKVIAEALKVRIMLPEWIPDHLMQHQGWPTWNQALRTVHVSETDVSLSARTKAQDRLAFDELYAHQLGLCLLKERHRRASVAPYTTDKGFLEQLSEATPFTLTQAQKQTWAEILKDMTHGARMIRLVQGDVGSGKTILAFWSLALAAHNGQQAVLLAPTEILARQHAATLANFAKALGFETALLIGAMKEKDKKLVREQLAQGQAQIVVGTHALIEESINFDRLGLVVIDEQHRFGVKQRHALISKGLNTHVLIMTATPIPRTLLLSNYGDLDISRLNEKPAGRQPIVTKVTSLEKIEAVVEGLVKALNEGQKAYWVCPLIDTSEESDLAAATARFKVLQAHLGEQVALLHGRMKPDEKDAIFQAFSQGAIRCLVSTTVIEVGVDVRDATLMIIEHGERFGLAQLHQLRGRIGRGDLASTCLLLYAPPLSFIAKERLETMRQTQDGFIIAEKDLELRGAGDVLGTKQSGIMAFRNADPLIHTQLLTLAHEKASDLIAQDPSLTTQAGESARLLMTLYGTFYELPEEVSHAPVSA